MKAKDVMPVCWVGAVQVSLDVRPLVRLDPLERFEARDHFRHVLARDFGWSGGDLNALPDDGLARLARIDMGRRVGCRMALAFGILRRRFGGSIVRAGRGRLRPLAQETQRAAGARKRDQRNVAGSPEAASLHEHGT